MAPPETDPTQLRRLAAALGTAAERLTELRLGLESATARIAGTHPLRRRWIQDEGPALGELAAAMRRARADLRASAEARERRAGRRMGGYASPAYLGSGRAAEQALRDVRFRAAETGAGIGAALLEGAPAAPLPGAWTSAHDLGAALGMPASLPTPDPRDEDD